MMKITLTLDDIVSETKKYIRTLTTINSGNYHYYQGYQDIGMYFFLLYVQNSFKSIAIFQRVTECFFKDYLNEKQDSYFPYNFILEIVEFLISNLDKSLYKEMNRILDVVSPYWTTSWVLSWFSHNIKDIFLVYRIFDYLLVAHPLAIYYMSAVLTIEQLKLMFSKTEDSANIMSAIQKLNFESLDFDDIIFKTEKAMERFKTYNVVKKFHRRLPKNSFLRARNLNIFTFYKSAYVKPVKVSPPILNYLLMSIIIFVFCIMANFYFKIPLFKTLTNNYNKLFN